jgi:hypothetical protein
VVKCVLEPDGVDALEAGVDLVAVSVAVGVGVLGLESTVLAGVARVQGRGRPQPRPAADAESRDTNVPALTARTATAIPAVAN